MAEYPMNPLPALETMHQETALLDAAITRALESAPPFAVPAHFAARVAGSAVAGRVGIAARRLPIDVPLRAQYYGRNAAIVCLGVLLAMIIASAPRAASHSPVWIAVEAVFCIQFALVAVWLVARELRLILFPSAS